MFTQDIVENSIKSAEKTVREVLNNAFPVVGRVNTLKVLDVELGASKNLYNLAAQKEMKLNNKSLTIPVSIRLELSENSSGSVIDNDKVTIIQLPVLTPRGSFIVDGTEYQATNQLRLRSGVYTRRQGDGNYETQVNLDAGFNNFKLSLNPKTKTFYITKGTNNMFLYPVMIGLGVTHQSLERYMGKELAEANRQQHGGKVSKELKKFALQFKVEKKTEEEIRDDINNRLFPSLKIDSSTTESTLGKGFSSVSTEMILTSIDKLRKVMLGDTPEDDRDSLEFKKFLSFDDHIEERIRNSAQKVVRKVGNRIDKATSVKELVSLGDFNTAVKAFFTTSSLSAPTEQTNPLSMFGDFSKVTIGGEGGVESAHAVTNAMRDINPSTLGFLDPVHTPESENIGALLHLSIHAKKKGDTLSTSVIDVKTGKLAEVTPKDIVSSCVAFPGQYDAASKKFKSNEVKAMQRKAVKTVKPSEVDYAIISSQVMFDLSTNMIPFLQNDQGNRAMMASKMQEQAISLKYREAPLVQSELADGQTFETMIGATQIPKAPEDGVIANIKPLTIKTKTGKLIEVELYDNFPLANGSFVHHTLRDNIKVGVTVKKGDVLAESNFTKDGALSIGTNMTVAFMPYKGYTFDDGIVVSETAAKKFTSEHLYMEDFELTDDHVVDKDMFRKYAPSDANLLSLAKLGSNGVIQKGSTVEEGDFLVAALVRVEDTEEERMRRSLSRTLKRDWRNDSLVWGKSAAGEVIDVTNFGKVWRITVKTEEAARQGDKIVGRHGNKGTISKVIPDGEMPETKSGQKIDVMVNPMALPSRMNVGQILESGASLIAKETGQTFKVKNFSGEDYLGQITKEMDRLGIKERQTVVDPDLGELETPIFVGNQYFLKLQHQTEKKFSARSTGGYTADEQPTRGSKNSGQALDALTNYTYLAHGAKENLREASVVKGQKNDEYWRAFRTGNVPPPPKVPFVFDKFINSIVALGLKVDKSDDRFSISALTDKEVGDMSSGAIQDALLLKGADLKVEKGGLFDQTLTGGHGGGKWAHVDLVEPLPNPIFENAIRVLLDMSGKQYLGVLNGAEKIDGLTGGQAFKKALSKINVEKELEDLKAFATSGNVKSIKKLDDAHKKIRYLNALEKTGKKPEDYILSKVPVLPPKFRPISAMDDGSLSVSDVNELYKHVVLLNTSLDKDNKSFLVDDNLRGKTREQLYNALGSVYGLCDPITNDARSRKRRGIISQLGGESEDGLAPKNAYFQSKIFRKRQDLSGRAVIAPGPELGIDEIGLPKEMAWKIYENHVLRDMVKNKGFSAAQARTEVENRTRSAEVSLSKVTSHTPVILNRAPSLHKFSSLAMIPKLIDGKTIELPSLLTRGYNADFDGDSMAVHVPVSEKARVEAMEKMLPSQNLFRPGFGTFMLAPVQEQILGLYFLTEKVNVSRPSKGKFGSEKDAIEAFRAHKGKDWRINDPITLRGKVTSVGIAKFNNCLPLRFRDYDMKRIDKKTLANMFQAMQDGGASNIEMSQSATALKNLGNKYLYKRGFTVGLSDLKVDNKKKEKVFSETEKKLGKGYTHENFVKAFSQAEKDLTEILKKDNADNAFTHMAVSGSKGNESNLRQILGAPGLLMDNMNRVVPVPVKHSYSEGLDPSEYWISLYGARKGMVDRQRSTSVPGALTKEVINNTIDHLVTLQDCGTKRGAKKDLSDVYVHDRYLAEDVGTLAKQGQRVTHALKREMQKAGFKSITVRSPLYCDAKNGVCSKCFGVMADGKPLSVGDNIGVIAGQAITEPTTQMTMNSFHTGGVASQEIGKEQGLPRVLQLLKLPEGLPNKATLADQNGKVTQVVRSPAGGYEVTIDKNVHFIGVGLTPTVKVGDTVKKGDKISTGVESPQDILRTKGLEETRNFLTRELSETYKGDIHHNILETIVQKMTDLTKVENPGNSTEVLPGEFVSYARVEALNRDGAEIEHTPTLRSIEHLPSYLNKDWIAKMNFRNIKKSVITSAQEAQESQFKGTVNPITAFAYGVDFGSTPGKY